MKKITSFGLYLFFTGMILSAKAQTSAITIGNGTSSGTSSPVASWYNSSATESIYLGTEIGSTGEITHLAYQKASGVSTEDIELRIYMKSTDVTAVSANYSIGEGFNDYTLVYDGTMPNDATSGWMEIELQTGFMLSSTSENLSVLVEGFTCIASGRPQYRFTTTQGNKLSAAYNDGSIGCGGDTPWDETAIMHPVWERPNIKLTKNTLSIDENVASNKFFAYTNNGHLTIKSFGNIASLDIYDLQGRQVFTKKGINDKEIVLTNIPKNHNLLLVKITDIENRTTIKKVVF